MYFESRGQAGLILAQELYDKYRYENCAIIALSEGSVLVAEQIAATLHCVLTLLLSEEIEIPGEGITYGAVSQDGDFTVNSEFTSGQAEGYNSEFHGYFDEEKRKAFQKINRLIGDGGTIDEDLLRDHTILLVADCIDDVTMIDVALDFVKPLRIDRLVVVTPVATVPVVNRLHVLVDEVHILDVKENFLGANHYYTNNDIPPREDTIKRISEIITKWR